MRRPAAIAIGIALALAGCSSAARHVASEDSGIPDDALRVCVPCHLRHHSARKRIPLTCLTDDNIRYAFKVLGARAFDYLQRRYAGDDPRLEIFLLNAHQL